jgi:hypothetical protein
MSLLSGQTLEVLEALEMKEMFLSIMHELLFLSILIYAGIVLNTVMPSQSKILLGVVQSISCHFPHSITVFIYSLKCIYTDTAAPDVDNKHQLACA